MNDLNNSTLTLSFDLNKVPYLKGDDGSTYLLIKKEENEDQKKECSSFLYSSPLKITESINKINELKTRYISFKELEYSSTYIYVTKRKIDKIIIPFFNDSLKRMFSLSYLEKFRNVLSKKDYCVKHKNAILFTLKDLISYSRKIKLITSDERDDMLEFLFPIKEKEKEIIKEEKNKYTPMRDLYKLLNNIDDFNDKALFRLLYFSGLRIGEFLGIQIKDIHFKNNLAYISIYKQKLSINGKISTRLKNLSSYKIIIYADENVTYLKEYIFRNNLRKEDFLFDTYRVKIQRKLNNYLSKAKLEHNSIHGFGRKSINTELYKLGADTKIRTTLLGQSSLKVNEQNYIDQNVALKKAVKYIKEISSKL